MIELHKTNEGLELKITPNRSASWRQTRLFIIAIGGFSFFVATMWALVAGIWAILPFAGLEVALLTYFMYRVSKSTYDEQIIHITDRALQLRKKKNTETTRWQLSQVKLRVKKGRHELDPAVLSFFDGIQKEQVFAEFLNQDDVEDLVLKLKCFLPVRYIDPGDGSLSA